MLIIFILLCCQVVRITIFTEYFEKPKIIAHVNPTDFMGHVNKREIFGEMDEGRTPLKSGWEVPLGDTLGFFRSLVPEFLRLVHEGLEAG